MGQNKVKARQQIRVQLTQRESTDVEISLGKVNKTTKVKKAKRKSVYPRVSKPVKAGQGTARL